MPRSAFAHRRAELIDWLCGQMECGVDLHTLSRRAGLPHWQTLMAWQRADPELKARFARARADGRRRNLEARFDDRYLYHHGRVEALLGAVRAGAALTDLVGRRPWPRRDVINAWKRTHPEFVEQLAAAIAQGRRLRSGPRHRPWDEAVADRITLRVMRGETMRAIHRAPDLPGKTVLDRWRREHPDWDGALKIAQRAGHRVAMARRRRDTPKLKARIETAIAMGADMTDLRGRPGFPDPATIYAWARRDPAFAAQLTRARAFRDDMREDALFDRAMAGDRSAGAKLRRQGRGKGGG